MNLKGKKVLLTGATGFIGGHVAESLIAEGVSLYCVIRKPNPKSYFYKGGLYKKAILIRCDLSNEVKVGKVLKKYKFDFVFHLAGVLRPKSMEEAFAGNVAPTMNLLKSSQNFKGIFLASSSRSNLEKLEGEKLNALMQRPYDFSKTISDLETQSFIKSHKVPVVVIKYANVFGPGDDLVKPLRLTSEIISKLKTGQKFTANDGGKNKVGLIYVKQVAEAFVKAAKNIEETKYKTIQLKSSVKYSVNNWAEKIRKTVKMNKRETSLDKAIIQTYNW